jgi:hypothetical protein
VADQCRSIIEEAVVLALGPVGRPMLAPIE